MGHADCGTIVPEKVIVVVGRTLQSIARVHLDLVPHIQTSERIKVAYALLPGSNYSAGVVAWERRNGIALVEWEKIPELNPALVVSASPHKDLLALKRETKCEVLTLPHGAGHNRLREEIDGVAGIARAQHVDEDGRMTSCIALPGPASFEHLQREFPEAVPNARITGDVCLERMRRSEYRRPLYRSKLGVRPDQRLVVISTTHGPNSLAKRQLKFIRELLDRLPDSFRVALIAHPNIEYDDGISLVTHLADHRANGLIMNEPDEWRDVSIAADVVLIDYGSTGFYPAALGRAVAMLPDLGTDEMVEDSPLRRFGEVVPRLDLTGDVERQLLDLIARFEREPLDFDFDQVIAVPEESPTQQVVDLIYELAGLGPAPRISVRSIPHGQPLPEAGPISARSVFWNPDKGLADLRAYPATTCWQDNALRLAEGTCRNLDLIATADVINYHDGPPVSEPEAAELARSTRQGNPLVVNVSVRIGENEAYIDLHCGQKIKVKCERRVLDWIATALCLMLKKLVAKTVGFDIAEALVYLKRVFKVPLTLVAA